MHVNYWGMEQPPPFRLKRLAARLFTASLTLSAAVAILAVLFGEFRETELKILGTTLTLAVASLCALPCAARLDDARPSLLSRAGVAAAVLAAGLQIAGIWQWDTLESEAFWKSVGTAWTLSVALAHAAFLDRPRLPERFRWTAALARASTAALAGLVILAVWTEWDEEVAFRLMGALSILATAMTIAVPVLGRMAAEPSPVGRCPTCGQTLPEKEEK